ncbi:hypothetical protein E4U30_007616 [Claviceps sp. LM220 group G6]|nr:hypothetical protein E4U15_004906 [Claviceps sp. LM218 group G6]KAG6091043.1 hypothetical protein E4U30_007616 [Claviceps sp. LM220 group G6]KAG6101379.1 hypothetical protein E4U14_006858 [Claviceps sp. LM454 group G7]KAG6106903.1 hypothetical protein E4U31_000492 [Claviceps sp. LM219 group G6]
MTAPAPTVPSLKEAFISAQTNLLSQPLAPSRTWLRANESSNQPIPVRLLDDILFTLNQTIQQHCRRVYPPQASYNVAEQISSSYLRDAEDRVRGLKESESTIGRELDFVADNSIEALPTAWPIEKDIDNDPAAAEEYESFVQRLTELTEQRRQLRLRVQQLRRIEASVKPLSATDENNIQDNLITKNGPVEEELATMRSLLVRITGMVAALPDEPTTHRSRSRNSSIVHLGDMTKAPKRNLDNFLSDPRVFPS